VIRALLIVALLTLLLGCSSSSSPPPQQHPRAGTTPRVRCVSDPTESQTRPLFFLFCVQSP
jgi:hypothetical protein